MVAALELSAAIFLTSLFALLGAVVVYDVYSATRLRWLLNPSGAPRVFRPTKQLREKKRFGAVSRAKGTAPERRPKTLWVARFASLEQKP